MYVKSGTTRRLYNTEPLVRHVEIDTKSDTTRRLYHTVASTTHWSVHEKSIILSQEELRKLHGAYVKQL